MNATSTPASYIARYMLGGAPHLLPVGARECQRAEEFFARVIREEDVARGRKALIIATLAEAATMLPFERALIKMGLIVCNAEASPYDGARTEATLRRFDVAVIAPVCGTALDAIAVTGFDAALLFRGKIVWAKPDVYARLQNAPGIDLRRWLDLGPVMALETRHGGGLLVDGREWRVEPEGNATYVSSRLDRAMPFERLRIPVAVKLNEHTYNANLPGPRVII
jgi:hypothetical protein